MVSHPPNRGRHEVGLVLFADGLEVVDRVKDGLVPVPAPARPEKNAAPAVAPKRFIKDGLQGCDS